MLRDGRHWWMYVNGYIHILPTFSTVVGGIIRDIYHAEDRHAPMSYFSGAVLFGTGLDPLITGFIQQRAGWRWMYYSQAIVAAGFLVALTLFFRETRGSVLLSRKAKALNEHYDALESAGYYQYGRTACNASGGRSRAMKSRESIAKMTSISCYRPFHLLFTEPVVFFFSLWVSFSWCILYLNFSAIPLVFSTNHNFSVEQSGALFSAVAIGSILATILSIYQEKMTARMGKVSSTPEGRLYFTSSFNYLADTYHRYASPAIAAQSFCRNVLAGVFPLVTNAMFKNLGYPAASSLLGGIGVLLTIVPWALVFYGPRIRARSKFTSAVKCDLGDVKDDHLVGSLPIIFNNHN
ncbi:hypothetical protein EYZ11_000786 [Aspergillus tanneri]|uniref:Major facilitator superfamily (MFS) profile domain-containing protein n=1 Tax=Aspergillus tanneri TaxID=1220188 RepID=A0A4S3JW94_9EURO|nr:hypothetical protein EYZ11_000786 [Aspergillus tanneri]